MPEGDIVDLLEGQFEDTYRLLTGLSDAQAMHRYADGKWSVKEVIGHLCDSERVFAYRALRIGRGDTTPLPGFDQDPYVPAGQFDARTMQSIADEFRTVRAATLSLLRALPVDAVARSGTASEVKVSVRALAYIIAGHERHHVALLRERYGLGG